MKIKKHQVGGITYTPFIPNAQQVANTSSATPQYVGTTGNDKNSKFTDLINKSLIDILDSNGIPSDVNAFLSAAQSFLGKSQSLTNYSLFGGDNDDYTLNDLIHIQSLAAQVAWNKGKWDEAIKRLNSENAWGEVALDDRGYIYTMNKEGEISTVSADDYSKDKSRYQALTNSQLLGLREQNSQFAMNTNLLNNVSGTIGMKTIQDYMLGLVEKLGTETSSGYTSKKGNQIAKGLEALLSGGPDGYYKVSNETQAQDVKAALTYLYSQLTDPMKKTLHATIAVNGGDPNKDHVEFLGRILTNNVDRTVKVDYDNSISSKSRASGSSGSSSKTVDKTLAEAYAQGTGFTTVNFPIFGKSQNTAMVVQAQDLGPVLQKDGKSPLGDANVEVLLNEAYGIGAIVNRDAVTFGDVPINWDDVSKLMYEGKSNMYRVWMPAKHDAFGRVRPDFKLHQKINGINEQLVKSGMTPGQIKSAIADIPGVVYNEQTGVIEAENMQLFLTFGAIASTDTLGKDIKNSTYLHPLSDAEDRRKKDKYNTVVGVSYSIDGTNNREKSNNPKTTWFGGYNFYEGNVYIPMQGSIIAAMIYNNEKVPQQNYMDIDAKMQARQSSSQKQMVLGALEANNDIRTTF